MSGLLNIRHSIVGQQAACNRAFDLLFAHIALKRPEPLLLAFPGPVGTGKTELAERLEAMFSAETNTVNCAGVRSVWCLFGAEAGHGGHETGTTLNNFRVETDGARLLVFLDEFDKTEQVFVDALLEFARKVSP
jgi:ATP-dependent Clp protease ATP-binding subunit ClpA